MIGFSVLALDSCSLGQAEGELSVKEVWLNIQERVTDQLSSLLSDRYMMSVRRVFSLIIVCCQIGTLPPVRH